MARPNQELEIAQLADSMEMAMTKVAGSAPKLAFAAITMLLFGYAICTSLGASATDAVTDGAAPIEDELSIGFPLGAGAGEKLMKEAAAGHYWLVPSCPFNPPAPASTVPLAIIDLGVLRDHPQLRGLIVDEQDLTGEGPEDQIGHGTLVAILAGNSGAPLLSIKVIKKNGTCNEEDVIAAIRWAVRAGANRINLSLGFPGSAKKHEKLCKLIASSDHTLFLAASGDRGLNVPMYPAACDAPNLISFAEVLHGQLTPESDRGDVAVEGGNQLVAPFLYFYEEGNRLAKAGKWTEAKSAYLRGLADNELPELHFQLGVLALYDGRPDEALAEFQRVKAMRPEFKDIDKLIAVASARTGH